jgi:hypothetical protein
MNPNVTVLEKYFKKGMLFLTGTSDTAHLTLTGMKYNIISSFLNQESARMVSLAYMKRIHLYMEKYRWCSRYSKFARHRLQYVVDLQMYVLHPFV